MKLIFRSAKFRNFFSFGKVFQEIEFRPGINMILGQDEARERSNASGKSSLSEVIPFAMFGRTNKGVRKDQIVNWRNRKGCEVWLRLQKEGATYDIMRSIRPDKLEIYKDGSLIPQSSDVRIYQKQLEQDVLGMDYQTFMSLVHTNLNSHIPILKMESMRKRQFLERVFGLELFSKLNETANKKLKTVSDRIYKTKVDQDGVGDVIGRLEEHNKSLRGNISELKSSDAEMAVVKAKEKSIYTEYGRNPEKKRDKLISDLQKNKYMLESKIEEYEKNKLEDTKQAVNSLDAQIKEISKKVDTQTAILNEQQALITRYETRIELKQGDVKVSKGQDVCQTCGAAINDVELCAKKEKEIVELKLCLDMAKKKVSEEAKAINGHKKDLQRLMKEYKTTSINGYKSERMEKLEIEIAVSRQNTFNTEIEIEKVKRGIEELNVIKVQKDVLEAKIEQEREARKGIESIISNNDAKIDELNIKIRENTNQLTRLSSITDYLEYARTICKDENIKQYAISAHIPYLTKQTNSYLAESGANFYIKFDNWLEEVIEGPGIYNCEYNNLSGGESRSVDLALQFAFLDVARIQAQVFPDILILDELLDSSVDATGLVSILNIIKAKQQEDNSKIFLVTHRSEISDIDVDNIYMVEKRDGFSHLRKIQ